MASSALTRSAAAPWPQYHDAYAPPPTTSQPLNTMLRGPSRSPSQIHPAVVRIVAPGHNSMSFGSGTLVYVGHNHGLVITNWHVVNEATGQISVHFPDGFYSPATIQKVDRDWDLAILSIRKPNVEPVPLATRAPHPGELLTIAGYGSGEYRAATGQCTQYVAPGLRFPFEMVEVAVSARQGDSGGPIFNERGELAGVLFGEGDGRTSGSYCGRVRWFLASIEPSTAGNGELIASKPLIPVAPRPGSAGGTDDADPFARTAAPALVAESSRSTPQSMPPSTPALPPSVHTGRTMTTVSSDSPATDFSAAKPPVASTRAEPQPPQVIGWTDIAGETLGQQVKTVLAAIGVLAMLLHVLKWMSTERTEPA